MNYVFRYVGDDPAVRNENRFFDSIRNGVVYTCRGGCHAPEFSSELIDIEAMQKRLGNAYKSELWTEELLRESFFKGPVKGWWIAPLLIFGLPVLLGLAIWAMIR